MKKAITFLAIFLLAMSRVNPAEAQSRKIIVQSDKPSEGLSVISDVDEEKFGFGKYLSDKDAYDVVIKLKYEDADDFHNGLAQVKLNGKWGVIDRDEKVVIPFRYDYMHSFGKTYKGLAWVKMNEKEGLIDKTGREIIPVKYDEIATASLGGMYEPLKYVGLVSVKYNGKWGALTLNGEEAIPVKYDDIGSGRSGMVPAEINKKWGVLDLNGKVIIPFKYDYTYFDPFSDIKDLIFVHLNHKKGVIDKTGRTIVPVIYDDIRSNTGNFICVKLKDKWGFFNKQGKEIAPPRFEEFFPFKNGLALVKENKRNFYIDGNGVAQKNYVKYFDLKENQIEIKGQYDENGKKTGVWEEYYENGQLKTSYHYLHGEKHGVFKSYYEDGTLWMHMDKFVNGKREGQWKSYHENGKPWTFIQLVNDKENGEFINHYKNGNIESKGRKVNGKETGEWKNYYDNGKLKQAGKMENGKAVGVWKLYYENGKLQATGEVKDGKQSGDWKFYNEDGSFKETKNVAQAIEKEKEDILKEINRLYKKSYKFTTEDGEKITIASVTLDGSTLVRKLSDGRITKTDLVKTGELGVGFLEKRRNYYISGGDYMNFFYEISTEADAIAIKDAMERLKKILK
jgi:antitoxin component YwqK of YwqJK toxin-antitoxin module